MPRIASGNVDYNLAMDPALLQAGKIVAAAEDRKLAPLLRHLLRQHIERHGTDEARHIYETSAGMPHGTRIAKLGGKPQVLNVQLPGMLLEEAKARAAWEERSVSALIRHALERYLTEGRVSPPDDEVSNEGSEETEETNGVAIDPNQLDIVSELEKIQYEEECTE